MNLKRIPLILAAVVLTALGSCRSSGEFGSEPEQLVDKSRIAFQSIMADTQFPGLLDLSTRCKAILIFPDMIRAAFFFGGRGGNGVLLARDENGQWSAPAFYTLGGISWGLQFGGQSSELIITIMSDKGLNAIMNREVTLGADAGLAIGELGKGMNAATGMDLKADMYAFARSEGLFIGISLEGSVIHPRKSWNQELYGQGVTPENILIDRNVHGSSKPVIDLIAAMP